MTAPSGSYPGPLHIVGESSLREHELIGAVWVDRGYRCSPDTLGTPEPCPIDDAPCQTCTPHNVVDYVEPT